MSQRAGAVPVDALTGARFAAKATESLVAGQIRVLELIVGNASLNATLDALVRLVEAQAPSLIGSVLLLDDDGVHVRHGAAPSLPHGYSLAIDGQPIGERAGSCGTAAYRRERVIVEDIQTDPLWEMYREVAAAYGLRACWSTPIFDTDRRVLGTFALYFKRPARPSEWHFNLIEMATQTAAVAIMHSRGGQERSRLLQDRRESDLVFRSVFDRAAVGMTIASLDGQLVTCNPVFAQMLGYSIEELAGRSIAGITHADDLAENMRLFTSLANGSLDRFTIEKRYLRKDGSPTWVRLTASAVLSEAGAPRFTVGMAEDINAHRRAEAELRESERRFRGILEGMTVGFIAFDRELRFTYVNPKATEMLGQSSEALVGQRYLDAFPAAAGSDFELDYRRALAQRVTTQTEAYFAPWDRWFEQRVDPTEDGLSVYFLDTTERRKSESRVVYLATHDGLTDLPNRNLIHDRITQALPLARRSGRHVAVLCVGLDRFRMINDGFGRSVGDAVLIESGARLLSAVSEGDTVARLGGDEFLVLLADLPGPSDAILVADRVLEKFTRDCEVGDRHVHVTASIGVGLFPQDGVSADELIASAHTAMARAKELGGNACQFHATTMSDATRRRAQLETELRSALARNQLSLMFQPRIELATGAIAGCEALLRWTHPTLGVVSPGEFIPIAEESGMIVPIGDWVLRTACEQARAWDAEGLTGITMSVNVSARQFFQKDILAWVSSALKAAGLPAERLELELTESSIAQDVERASATIRSLKDAGIRVAIDDFGTGYSNLGYLRKFRADTLKIDQSFVRNLDLDPDDASIIVAVIALAHSLNMTAVAEGVETESQCRFLWLHRCEEIQGYHFSRAVPPDEIAAMLREDRRMPTMAGKRRRSRIG